TRVDPRAEAVEHVLVTVVAHLLSRCGDRQPFEGSDLLVGGEGGCGERLVVHLGAPVEDALLAPAGQRVLRGAERWAERDLQARLLTDLAHRGLRRRLARIDLALG